MDTQLLVAVNIMAFSAMIAAVLLARRDWNYAWSIGVQLCILAAGGCALYFSWPHAGSLTFALFTLLFLLPVGLMLVSQRKAAGGDTAGSVKYAQWAARVHPTPVMRLSAQMTAAQAIEDAQRSAAAFRALAAVVPPRNQALVAMSAERALDRWAQVLSIIEADRSGTRHAVMKIRALGETGRLEEMVAEYNAVRARVPTDERSTAELFVLAFAGREAAVAQRLDAPRSAFDAETRSYWKAIAKLYAGKPDDGALAAIAQNSRRGATRLAATRHLQEGAIAAREKLSPEALAVVATLETRTARGVAMAAMPRSRAYATLALLLANTAMFAAELWRGDPENLETLFTLGGLWPPSIVDAGEWWRLASALFLHFGWAHFLVNMASLYALGRPVEARFGTVRMLLIYLLGGIGSSASVLFLMQQAWIAEALLVGASGAVMALFGGLLAYQVFSWRRSRDDLDRGPVVGLLAIVALQTAIDISLPQVSLAGHLSGFVCGFLIALTVLRVWPKPEGVGSGAPASTTL